MPFDAAAAKGTLPLLVIVNPAAGNGRAVQAAAKLEAALRQHQVPYRRVDTAAPGHARSLAAASDGTVVAAGGDGTVHEVVDGLPVRAGMLGPLAVLPCGRGDDFAMAAGCTQDAAELAARLATRAAPRLVDVGEVTVDCEHGRVRRRFVNAIACGFDAEVAAVARTHRRLRGQLLYVVSTLQALWRSRAFTVQIAVDGAAPSTFADTLMLATCNGGRVGGGMKLAPDARCDDGHFDVVHVASRSRFRTLCLLALVVAARHRRARGVSFLLAKQLDVTLARPTAVAVDGELLAERATALRVGLHEQRVRLQGSATSRFD